MGKVQSYDNHDLAYFYDVLNDDGEAGTISNLLGDVALANDVESRLVGMPYVADRLVTHLSPDMSAYLQSFVEGVNAYIDAVRSEAVEAPSELQLASGLLGASTPADLMHPWSVRDVAAMAVVIMYQTTFDTDDIARTRAAATHGELFAGDEHEALVGRAPRRSS